MVFTKYVKKRAKAKTLDEIEEIRKLTLEEIKKDKRWRIIWEIYRIKKQQFPELSDELIIEQAKQQIIALRQLSRLGFV